MNIAAKTHLERVIAVAILVLAVAILLAVTAGYAFVSFSEQRDRVTDIQNILNRFEATIDRQQKLADRFARDAAASTYDGVFLEASERGLGAARLQDQIGTLARSSGVQMRRVSVVDGGAENRLALQVQVTGDLVAITGFLVDIESSRPWLFVESLNISQVRQRRSAVTREPGPSLVVMLTVAAFTGPGEAAADGQETRR